MKIASLVVFAGLAVNLFAQPGPQGGGGPSDHKVLSATSKDGLTWTRDEGVRIHSASVPCVVNDGDKRILCYFVQPPGPSDLTENVACAVSTDGTTFTIDPKFQIGGLSTLKSVDPSIVRDKAGRFRLYYLASDYLGDPANEKNPHKINQAVSDDGIRFKEAGTVFSYDDLVDPDVFEYKGRWFMYVFGKGGTVVATSPDGNKFTYSGVMSPPNWGTTAPIQLPDGRLRLYAFEQRVPIGNAVGSFISTNGIDWVQEPGVRLQAAADEQVTDPFVIPWRGGYKMYFKTSPARMRNVQQNGPQNFRQQGTGQSRLQNNPGPNNFTDQPQPQQQRQNMNAEGPWNADVLVYRASKSGSVEKAATFERAGVPTMARMKDGRLIAAFQHFPADDQRNFDRVGVCFSSDEGATWTKAEPIAVEGLSPELARPFDPTLVPLPDGRVRIYFTSNRNKTPDFRVSTPAIYSAISKDGVNYVFEPGVRFGIEGRIVIDCAVVLHNGVFHMFVPDNGSADEFHTSQQNREKPRNGTGYHAVSKDGLNFTREDDVTIPGSKRWLGNAFSDGKEITFIGTGDPTPPQRGERPKGSTWMATSKDGKTWTLTEAPDISGGDPGAVKSKDGGLVVVITGQRVRGNAGGRQGGQFNEGQNQGPARSFENQVPFRENRQE